MNESGTSTIRVLLIDSEKSARSEMEALVRKYVPNPEIIECEDAGRGVSLLAESKHDLLIVDINSPGFDINNLLDVFKKVSAAIRPTRVILCSPNHVSSLMPDVTRPITYFKKPIEVLSFKNYLIRSYPQKSKVNKGLKLDPVVTQVFPSEMNRVLSAFAMTESKKARISIRKPSDQIKFEISACIDFICSKFKGRFVISTSHATYLKLLNSMLGANHLNVNTENSDALGEMCNQVFCLTRRILNEHDYAIGMARPQVFFAPEGQGAAPLPQVDPLLWVGFTFETPHGVLDLDLQIQDVPQQAP